MNGLAQLKLRKNFDDLCSAATTDLVSNVWFSFGCSAVVHANAGDTVYVYLQDGHLDRDQGTFVGLLLDPDFIGAWEKSG